jgi:hypothetical protein
MVVVLTCPGMASNFPWSAGTQKLWMTSPAGAVISHRTGSPCGIVRRSTATTPFG